MIEAPDLLTIALLVLLEGLLSADNAMVLAVLVLGLPKAERKQALRYGIFGAFVFRGAATLLAVHLIALAWVKLVGGGYLLYLVYRHFSAVNDAIARRTPPKAQPMFGLTAFWATVTKVELTDLIFAIDSILVAVAMSPKAWVVLTGGVLGIIAMRLVIGKMLSLIERYPPLVDAAFIIIAWVAIKLFVEYLHTEGYTAFEIPKWLSLGAIVLILGIAFLYARTKELRGGPASADEQEARRLLDEGDTP